jgi:hypothetical protein
MNRLNNLFGVLLARLLLVLESFDSFNVILALPWNHIDILKT